MLERNVGSNPGRSDSGLPSGVETVIGPGVRIDGHLKSPSNVVIHGSLEGNVDIAGILVVGESGRLIGDVTARDVIVRGAVEGRIVAGERIELGPSGRVQGDLQAKAVSIAEGAYLQGKVAMSAPFDSPSTRQRNVLATAGAAV
jgi:cytoskeletal protein CcmA (bactofilin family)